MNRIALSALILFLLQACGPKEEAKVAVAAPQKAAPSAVKEATKSSDAAVPKDYTEKLFQNPFDPDAVYFLSQRSGTSQALVILIKRDSQDGTQYSRWQFNCVDQTAQNLGVATNLQDLSKSGNSAPTASTHYESKSKIGAIASAVCP